MELVTPDIGLIFWSSITFILLLFSLRKFAWRPMLTAINKRESSIREALASAEDARKEMQNLQAENERLLNEARQERDKMLAQAQKNKSEIIASAKEKAENEAQKVISSAKVAIEQEKQEAIKTLRLYVAEMAIDISEKIISEEFADRKTQLSKVEALVKDMSIN